MDFTTATPVMDNKKSLPQPNLKPFTLPDCGADKLDEWVCAVNPTSPIEYFQIGQVNFDKKVFPSAFSDMARKEEYFAPQLTVRLMSQKQADAILERAKATYVRIASRRNPKFDPRDRENKEPEQLPEEIVCLGNVIILCKKTEYNPYAFQKQTPVQAQEETETESSQDVGVALIVENGKRSKK